MPTAAIRGLLYPAGYASPSRRLEHVGRSPRNRVYDRTAEREGQTPDELIGCPWRLGDCFGFSQPLDESGDPKSGVYVGSRMWGVGMSPLGNSGVRCFF